MWRRPVSIGSFLLGCIDWIGRLLIAEDIIKGRAASFVREIMNVLPSYFGVALILIGVALFAYDFWDRRQSSPQKKDDLGSGGKGGDAKVVGKRSKGWGGAGGKGGIGDGGAGGDVEVVGDDSMALGGAGGDAAQWDGRGGQGARSPMEETNETQYWKYGAGASGGNTQEYNRRMEILTQIRQGYLEAFPAEAPFINAGIDQVRLKWVNKRLEELGEEWRIRGIKEDGGYIMPPLRQDAIAAPKMSWFKRVLYRN